MKMIFCILILICATELFAFTLDGNDLNRIVKIIKALPTDTELVSIEIKSNVKIIGKAPTYAQINNFVEALKKTSLFAADLMMQNTTKLHGSSSMEQFTLVSSLR